ncbi:MAG: glycosyltransferase family 2 protein, partial [Methanobrevibacter sp.]|nr:glycosyltransferase family 2 protein [Methanobrevibacter sp.]
ILNLSKWDSKTFLAKYKYFNRLNKVKSQASLYIDIGNGFNEQDKILIEYVPALNNKLVFDLSNFSNILNLRFDPLEGDFIKSKLNNINVTGANCDNSISDEYQLFTNLDPYYIFEAKFDDKLTIDFDLIFLNKNDIVNLLNEKINKSNEINQKTKKSRFKFL